MMKATLILAAIAISTLPGWAVEMKLKWQPGKRYVFEHSSEYTAKMPLPGQGLIETKGKLSMTMNNDVAPHEKGVSVGYDFAGIRMKTEMQGIVMEYDSENPAKSGGLLGTMFQPLAEAKWTTTYSKDGKLLEVKGLDQVQAPGQLGLGKAELEAMTKQSSLFVPNKDVNPGDSWEAEMNLPMGAVGGDLSLVYTFKLEAIEQREGKAIAKVSISGKMKDALEDGGETVLDVEAKKVSGEMLFDLDLGQPIELRTAIELEMALPAGIPVEEGAPGKIPMKTLSVQKLLKVEDLSKKAEKPAGKKEGKAAPEESSSTPKRKALTDEEKAARKKARREKRKEKAGKVEK